MRGLLSFAKAKQVNFYIFAVARPPIHQSEGAHYADDLDDASLQASLDGAKQTSFGQYEDESEVSF